MHLVDGAKVGVEWLFALADRRMRVAIAAMHQYPAHQWILHSLAQRAGMSRTGFAVKFKETVGKSPMEYLTHWRMLVAGDRLVSSGDSLSVIARSLCYESDSAFSTAFKRVTGYCQAQPRPRFRSSPARGTLPGSIGSHCKVTMKSGQNLDWNIGLALQALGGELLSSASARCPHVGALYPALRYGRTQ